MTDHPGNVYAGGRFTNAGCVMANPIAKWDGNAWNPNYLPDILAMKQIKIAPPNPLPKSGYDVIGAGQITFGSQRRSFPSQPSLFAQKETVSKGFSDRINKMVRIRDIANLIWDFIGLQSAKQV